MKQLKNNENISEHQNHVITNAVFGLLPTLDLDTTDMYVRDVWTSVDESISISIEDVKPAQFEHLDMDHLNNIQFVQPADNEVCIKFESHGKSYVIYIRKAEEVE